MKAKGTNMIKDRMISDPSTIAGFASGMLIMYLTGLVVPS
jgi:hypothetical protein